MLTLHTLQTEYPGRITDLVVLKFIFEWRERRTSWDHKDLLVVSLLSRDLNATFLDYLALSFFLCWLSRDAESLLTPRNVTCLIKYAGMYTVSK